MTAVGEILERQFYGNRVSDYLLCLAIIAGGILVLRIVVALLRRRLTRWAAATATTVDDFLVERLRKTGIPLAYLGLFSAALRTLSLTPRMERIVDSAGIVLLTLLAISFLVALIRYGFQEFVRKRGEDASKDRALKGAFSIAKGLVWGTGILFLLDNLGFRISTVVAGLGIGGIAVALAAQTILGDVFAYFTILFDRPFEIGDFIVVGEFQGTIERLGIKTTRLASISGEQIIMSNKDLTDSRVRNFKRMARRRVVFRLGVTYRTSAERLREIPGIVAGVFREIEGTALDRVHFFSFGDSSLLHEIVYFVDGNDYARYMDVQQAVNLRIIEEFGKRGIEFAYPTQTLYLKQG
jgi:small-conductance mechanosensitive channel